MILIDVNVLLIAVNRQEGHAKAKAWLEDQLWNAPRVGLPWASLIGFVRIITNARIYPRPLSLKAAWGHVEDWLAAEPVWIPQPTERHAEVLGELLLQRGGAANLMPDAHLAALALEHGLEVCSTDSDFARFVGVHWSNPLA